MRRPFSVTLCGYYGFGNVGDELLASSIIRLLQEAGIEKSNIAVLSNDPANTARSLGTASADRWKPKEVFSILRQSRTLLLGGGGLFQDTTSVRSCLYYWGVISLARLAGTVPWMFGQSVGPFRTAAGKFLARDAIGKCRARAVRDEGSRRILSGWGYDLEITPDPVLYLGEDSRKNRTSTIGDYILANVRPWQGDLPHILLSELDKLKREQACPLRFIALSGDDQEFLEENLSRYPSLEDVPRTRISSFSEARGLWEGAKAAVGMRLHFTVLSTIFKVPCIAIPYDPKVRYFAEDHGLPIWEGMGSIRIEESMAAPTGLLEQERERIREVFISSLDKSMGGC